MIGAIILNYRHINSISDEMKVAAVSLDLSDADECGRQIEYIEDTWKQNEAIFSLSVNFKETDHLGETILALKAAHKSGSAEEFEKARELLVDAIDGVCRLERFSVLNIF